MTLPWHNLLIYRVVMLILLTLSYLSAVVSLVWHLLVTRFIVEVPICNGKLPDIIIMRRFLVVRPWVIVRTWALPLLTRKLSGKTEGLVRPSLMCSALLPLRGMGRLRCLVETCRLLSRCSVACVKQLSLGRACPFLSLVTIIVGNIILRLLKCRTVRGLESRMSALTIQAWNGLLKGMSGSCLMDFGWTWHVRISGVMC